MATVENQATWSWLLCRVVCSGGGQGVDSGVFEAVAGSFEGQDFGVVHDAVDHRGGDDLVAEDIAPRANGRFEVKISEACS